MEGKKRISQVHEEWQVEEKLQQACTTYVRYADQKCPYGTQRSLAKTVLHLQRKGGFVVGVHRGVVEMRFKHVQYNIMT